MSVKRLVQFLAGRWAVKEAAFKALQPHYRLAWRDVCVAIDGSSGKPDGISACIIQAFVDRIFTLFDIYAL